MASVYYSLSTGKRQEVIAGLGEHYDKPCIPCLLVFTSKYHFSLPRQRASELLLMYDKEKAYEAAERFAHSWFKNTRGGGYGLMNILGDKRSIPSLARAMSKEECGERSFIAKVL